MHDPKITNLTLLHSERPKLYGILAYLSAIALKMIAVSFEAKYIGGLIHISTVWQQYLSVKGIAWKEGYYVRPEVWSEYKYFLVVHVLNDLLRNTNHLLFSCCKRKLKSSLWLHAPKWKKNMETNISTHSNALSHTDKPSGNICQMLQHRQNPE